MDRSEVLARPATSGVRQFTRSQVLGVWAAAALPMAALSWIVAPIVASQLGGEEPFARALIASLTAGLAWQAVLVVLLLRSERRAGYNVPWRQALWLQSPQRGKRTGGRLWLMVIPFIVLFGLVHMIPGLPAPANRDFAVLLSSDSGKAFLDGAWGWYGMLLLMGVLNTVVGEELLFRGVLLPRMRDAFGRGDWLANGVLFGCYHLHVPWSIPVNLLDTFILSYGTSRYRSAWFGIIVHSAQTLFVSLIVLAVVA